MASNIKGINIKIGAETKGLDKAISDVNKKASSLQGELKEVNKLLKFDPKNTTLLAQKQEILAKSVENTKEKLDRLKAAQADVNEQFKNGQISEEQYRAFQREIEATASSIEYLETKVKSAGDKWNDFGAKAKAAGEKVSSIGKKMSVISAGIVAAGTAGVKAAMDSADEYVKLSDETGLSLGTLQEYAYVGGQVGVELNTIASAQAKLTKSMSSARDGTGTQAEAFAKLGVSVTDANGELRDAKIVMGEAFAALDGIDNETERDATAMDIFGKSAADLNPLIKLGTEGLEDLKQKAHETGAVMSDDTVKSLDDFGDSVEGLKSSAMGAVAEAAIPLVDGLKELAEWFAGLDAPTKQSIISILAVVAVIGPLLVIIGNVITAVGAISTAIGAAGGALALLTGPVGIVIALLAGLVLAGIAVYKNWDSIKAFAMTFWTSLTTGFTNLKNSLATIFTGIINNFTTIWYNVTSFLSGLPDEMMGYGADIIQGLINGIKSKIKAVRDAIVSITSEITGKIRDILDINSPSKVLFQLGEYSGQGFANGIASMTKEVGKQTSALTGGVTSNAGTPQASTNTNQTINVTVNNPTGETSENSTYRQLMRLSYLGAI